VWGLTPEQALAIARAAVPQLAGEGGEGPAAQTAQARTRAERAAAAAASQGEGPGPGAAWPADDSEPTLEEVQAAAARLKQGKREDERLLGELLDLANQREFWPFLWGKLPAKQLSDAASDHEGHRRCRLVRCSWQGRPL
jgi:hypothetical protein